MPNDETSGESIFDALPKSLKATTSIERIGNTTVDIVDPEKVALLIDRLIKSGVRKFHYKDGLRELDPELAKMFAQAARDMLLLAVKELGDNNIPVERAMNWGSTIDGIVTPNSDVDITIDLPTKTDMANAWRWMRSNEGFRNGLAQISNHRIHKVEYSLVVPSLYAANPGEKWIPGAGDIVKIEI